MPACLQGIIFTHADEQSECVNEPLPRWCKKIEKLLSMAISRNQPRY